MSLMSAMPNPDRFKPKGCCEIDLCPRHNRDREGRPLKVCWSMKSANYTDQTEYALMHMTFETAQVVMRELEREGKMVREIKF